MKYKSKNIEDLLTDASFIRWINEEADASELAKWEDWIRQDPANASTYHRAIELYRSLRFQEEHADTIQELNKLKRSVFQFESARANRARRKSYYPIGLSIAALMLLALLFTFQRSNMAVPASSVPEKEFTEVATKYGQMQRVSFPDGSAVTLNANSLLKYSTPFLADEVELFIEGEAYFSIQSSAGDSGLQRKFTIHTADGVINILGTGFNVNTRNNETTVVLDRGEVELVKGPETVSHDKNSYLMIPGELARFSASDDDIEVQKVRTDLYTSWIDLKWIFEDTPLTEIAERIESTYGLKVIINDERAAEMRFSGTAPNQNLSVLLESLKVLLGIPVEAGLETITIGE